MTVLAPQIRTVKNMQTREVAGSVAAVRGLSVLVKHLQLPIGSVVRLQPDGARVPPTLDAVRGEVVGFDGQHSIVMLFNSSTGITPGVLVIGETSDQTVPVGPSLLGRIIDGLGRPIDGGRRIIDAAAQPLQSPPTSALKRRRITEPLATGIRCIDGMLTLGKGQRIGIFSGAGVGKSTLLATMARNTSADVNVIGLIGERGREVRDFIEQALGEGLKRSVIVVATGDQSPVLRVRAAMVTCAVAEYFRDQGADVMLMMDSMTRFAQAQRQVGLNVGEQPATKGYTPSVFAMLPMILERAGAIEGGGSITGIYAVLVDGDDLNEPIADAARGVLDGHIVLSRALAARGHFPAINVLESISRVADDVCDENHTTARRQVQRLLASYAEVEELINIGAYARGSNPLCDVAIHLKPSLDGFLQQRKMDSSAYPQTCRLLLEIAATSQQELMQRQSKSQAGAGPMRRAGS